MENFENKLQEESKKRGSCFFDKSLLDKVAIRFDKIVKKKPYYVMGVATDVDKKAFAYCLSKKIDGIVEIVLCKTMRNEDEFNQEVENLAKYFNAEVFYEN